MEYEWKRTTVRLKASEYEAAQRIFCERDTNFSQWLRACIRLLIADEEKRKAEQTNDLRAG